MKRAIYIIGSDHIKTDEMLALLNSNDEQGRLQSILHDLQFDPEDMPELDEADKEFRMAVDSPLSDNDLHEALCLWIYEGEDRPEAIFS